MYDTSARKPIWRYAIPLALALILALLCACAQNESGGAPPPSPAPVSLPTPLRNTPARPTSTPAPSPEFTVQKQVVHIFGEGEATQLYCGFEAVNTGDCPAAIETVSARFNVKGHKRYSTDFKPVASGFEVILPGEKTFCALWLPAREADFPESPEVALSLELSARPADDKALPLLVKNARVIQNYPGFATLSGSLWNESGEECPLNIVYAAFYDEADALLGVFHFTKNASIHAGEFTNFVVHMKPMPIPDLARNTARIETRAFGVE